jgi:hypothetical protein
LAPEQHNPKGHTVEIIAYLLNLVAHVGNVLATFATESPILATAIVVTFVAFVVTDEVRHQRRQRAQRTEQTIR